MCPLQTTICAEHPNREALFLIMESVGVAQRSGSHLVDLCVLFPSRFDGHVGCADVKQSLSSIQGVQLLSKGHSVRDPLYQAAVFCQRRDSKPVSMQAGESLTGLIDAATSTAH